ncbi:hypothetical protein ACJJTC_008112 [Scirpophaga incertulas]
MPSCCVPNCTENGGHKFPRDAKLKKLWLKAIRRVKFEPKSGARVCHKHFVDNDYGKIGKYSGIQHQRRILKKTAIPSVFFMDRPAYIRNCSRKNALEFVLAEETYFKKKI